VHGWKTFNAPKAKQISDEVLAHLHESRLENNADIHQELKQELKNWE
jgi:hypothetical protein